MAGSEGELAHYGLVPKADALNLLDDALLHPGSLCDQVIQLFGALYETLYTGGIILGHQLFTCLQRKG